MQNERLLTNTASPTVSPTASPSEVVPVDDCISEEMTDDAAGVKGESSTKGFEPSKELHSRPSKSQEYIQGVSVRPSVIQKLEKGQQQPLEFVHKIGSGVKEFNPVGIGQATNNRQSLICPSVISSAPASCLPGSSYDRPVTTKTTRSPAAASLGPVRKCDPNKVDRYLEQPDRGSRNSVLSSNLETSSVSYQKPKESDRKSLCTNSDKLIIREDVKSQCKTLSTGAKVREFMGTEGSLKSESLSKLAVNQAINVNKTGMPSNKGLFEDAAAKHREKFFSGMDQTQEEKHLVFNKSAFLEQKRSVISETKFARGCLQSACNQPEEAAQDLWKEEQVDQEDKNYESRASEMSFDCSSFHSLTDQSKVTATEVNISEEVYADLPLENKTPKPCVSEVTFDSGIPVQSGMNQPGLAVKEVIVQKEDYIHLGRKNVEPSGSEISLDFYVPPHSVINSPEIALEKLNLQKEEQIYLESKVNEPSVSELSLDYIFHSITGHSKDPLQEVNLQKEEHMHLENKGNGPGISEIMTDHPNIKEHINVQDKESELSVYETGLDSGVHLHQSVTQKPEIAVKEIWLQKEKLVKFKSKSAKFSGSETGSDVPHYLVTEPQIAVEEISVQKEEHVLEKRDKYSSSGIMFADVPPQSMTETPHIAVLKEDRVDLEGESTGSRGFAINVDIGAPLHSVIGQPQPTLLKERNVLLEDK
uniref:Zinc finger DBF-type containing 2 n=1 Tax=Panthera leo TaxID=9689 RepID=A0A8C9D329_PANLE